MSNRLIVESENDKYFIEAFIKHLNLDTIKVGEPICSIDEYKCLGGIGNLKNKLQGLKADIEKHDIQKIGIIFDADDLGIEKRTKYIKDIISSSEFEDDSIFKIYIMNINGKGELETVLKEIANKDCPMANCLEDWKKCLLSKDKEIKQKDFDKFWVNVYQRYDRCTEKESKQAGKNCNNEASFKKDIYDFEHKALDELKEFLKDL